MNTEQVGILLVSTLNTTNNETVRTISNPNIGRLRVYIIEYCELSTRLSLLSHLKHNKGSNLLYKSTYVHNFCLLRDVFTVVGTDHHTDEMTTTRIYLHTVDIFYKTGV